ncbi:MAG: ABC transporter ATP-binding protein [Bacilli bacterium]
MEKILEVKNLKQYFKVGRKKFVKAVDDISFHIYKGETFGLVGESGSGKSTTGRAIIKLYKPTSGSIIFDGVCVSKENNAEVRKLLAEKMQMIFQDPMASLNPRMKVIDIIAEGLDINKLYKTKDERTEKVFEILNIVGLSKEHAYRYPHEFSGGQRQRIGIARALITNPTFVIADEAISALDVSVQAQVVNLMNKLKSELGLTYLFIAHDLSMVKYISDRIAVMSKGKIVEMGTTEDIYANARHPYTRSLLSAIPHPNPASKKMSQRILYNYEDSHDYTNEQPEYLDVSSSHVVYATKSELKQWEDDITSSK